MPNKTIYVKDADLPLFERAQEQLGDSVSSLFAEFLRERLANLTPDEHRVIELLNKIVQSRVAAQQDRDLPKYLDSQYAEAETEAKRALKSLRAREPGSARGRFYAANVYLEWAERDRKHIRELRDKLAELLAAD